MAAAATVAVAPPAPSPCANAIVGTMPAVNVAASITAAPRFANENPCLDLIMHASFRFVVAPRAPSNRRRRLLLFVSHS
ncbi:hypothetical protein C1876_01765 [Eggerthella sinensis]|uniref:Uncharacterized protein n=1 Tax=Eggerthella sinensis TaxID=242230 RepID=A0A3N0IYJ5_9ACTN|nr:hypothetical protein C1876_01765 [Eggerthella sinensis]RNM42031.1 hypothetical protein DMP09_06995 [Eggerthella sinensis]